MGELLQDLLDLEYPLLFIISVAVSIVVVMFTTFYFDQKNRKKERHQKEVNLKPDEADEAVSTELSSESEKSAAEEEVDSEIDEEIAGDEAPPACPIPMFCGGGFGVGGGGGDVEQDEVEAASLLSRLKAARLKEIEEALTEEQLNSEKETEQEQLQAIFELLRKQESELDMNPMDEHDLKAQLKMYR